MKNWLICKLGGYPAPEEGIALLVYPDPDDPKGKEYNVAHIEGGKDEVIYFCGGVPMPTAGEGQHVVGPVVRHNPVRSKKSLEELGKRTGALVTKPASESSLHADYIVEESHKETVYGKEVNVIDKIKILGIRQEGVQG
ncbi:MAG: hypothetical protein PHY28_04345 [Dehalococcoidales bacterium]|nr:hypothetical protein [Dehalococcoidales bacterium]